MKLGPQGDKKGLGLGPDLRKDGSMDSGHHLKVSPNSLSSPGLHSSTFFWEDANRQRATVL